MRKLMHILVVVVLGFTSTVLAGPSSINLSATVRDFSSAHPDFERTPYYDSGFVANTIGADQKPVYIGGAGGTLTTTGPAYFNQWYNNVLGTNMTTTTTLTLNHMGGGIYSYDNTSFFPIDGQLFGNEGLPHNYHFTLELHSQFTYEPGQVFNFTGDDDIFVFINGELVMDLGGIHGPQSSPPVYLDTLGLTAGNTYSFDLFFAERCTSQSNFRMDTSIVLQEKIPAPGAIVLGSIGVGLVSWLRRRRTL